MRYIQVPQDLQLVHPETGASIQDEPYTFTTFIVRNVLVDPERFGKGFDALKAAFGLDKVVRGAKPGEILGIDTEWWERIVQVLDKPAGCWPMPLVAMQMLPFMEAIKSAKETHPTNGVKPTKQTTSKSGEVTVSA